jgi:hypothetical protein
MPMNPRLLRPIASGVNKDAVDWRDRVVANSGTVSTSTFRAVSTFCNEIDRAGIRDKFYRLNLFCGTGLNACLVPLYRGPSRTGTQYGNTTDTNTGPFVSGDYNETGSSGGLVGNGSSKWLETGFSIASSSSPLRPKGHLSAWIQSLPNSRQTALGVRNDVIPRTVCLIDRNDGTESWGSFGSTYIDNVTMAAAPHMALVQQTTQTEWYSNASSATTAAAQTVNTLERGMTVFGLAYQESSVLNRFTGRLGAYSAGLDLTSSQVASYYTALEKFMVALGRK